METFVLIGNIINGLLLLFVIVKIYYAYITDKQIGRLITEYYNNHEIKVIRIDKLNLSEKIRYGVPINILFRFYSYIFRFFSLNNKPVRKIELQYKNTKEQIIFIELVIKKRQLILCDEFDSYDI